MKKKKSMFGMLADKNNPVFMEEIVQEIKRDRRESDERREAVFDAIGLTFAPRNDRARKLYQSLGFEDIDVLRIPLGVNPAAQNVDLKSVKVWRDERHFVYIINATESATVKSFLKRKQKKQV